MRRCKWLSLICLNVSLTLSSTVSFGKLYELPSAQTPVPTTPATQLLKEISNGLTAASLQAKKTLVYVSVTKTMSRQGPMMVDPFDLFGGGGLGIPPQGPAPKQEGLGSGFFVDLEKRLILTNNHVVDGADTITAKLANGEVYPAKVLGRDPNTDVAVLQLINESYKQDGLGALILGDSDESQVGAMVLALGAPFGMEASVSLGVISAKGRGNLQITAIGDFIQTDAAINQGNSGGPLVDPVTGKVWGINSAILSPSGANSGIGLAIPSNLARQVVTALINDGAVHRAWVGIGFQPFRSEWAQSMKLPKGTGGVIVLQVTKDGPADKAGIQPQDVITSIDGKALHDENNDLANIIGLKKPGEKVQFDLYRNGKQQSVSLAVSAWEKEASEEINSTDPTQKKKKSQNPFGISFKATNKGLVITGIDADSPAYLERLAVGDIVRFVNGQELSPQEFEMALRQSDEILLYIERKDKKFMVHLSKK